MDINLSSESMMQGNHSCGGFDLRGPTRVPHHQQQYPVQHQSNSHPGQGSFAIQDNFPFTIGTAQDCEKHKSDKLKSASEEDEQNISEDVDDPSKGKKASPWHRVKWTDTMVRLLITAVSYINEEAAVEHGARRKCVTIQKKGKWKSISKVMAERGHVVSPQQCEDKFNDLNKRYKRLNEILGRGTSCEVVENSALLDVMDHISEKSKEEVRKILSSKHLHYEEMCSYHNGNRLHLPPDPELQHSLRLALRSKDDHDDSDMKKNPHDDNDDDAEFDDCEEGEENEMLHGDCRTHGFPGAKRAKQCLSREDFSFTSSFNSADCNKGFSFQAELADTGMDKIGTEGLKTNVLQKEVFDKQKLQIEEQRLEIEAQLLELEKEQFKWQRYCWKKDRELESRRMEIERMKLENERMALELRRKEIEIETGKQA